MPNHHRYYNFADSELLQHASTVAQTLPRDIEAFIDFDSTLTKTYADTIKTSIKVIQELETDRVIISQLAEKTQLVNNALAACNTAYRTIKFFVAKAFADNKAIQRKFSANNYAKLRQDHAAMILFFGDLIVIAEQYRAELIAAGCNAAVIDSLENLKINLSSAKSKQELFKKERIVLTQHRVDKLNDLYKLLVPISELAQIIFNDNSARLASYLLPKSKSASKKVTVVVAP